MFGSRHGDTRLYRQALKSCCLDTDMTALPSGDSTEIGENGVNLSGGQKQRVSLARAVLSEGSNEIVLLDDPLSAVDPRVADSVFNGVLSNDSGLLKDRTRVMVTHNVSFLPHVDRIVVLDQGKVAEQGTYEELMEREDGVLSSLVAEFGTRQKGEQEKAEEEASELKRKRLTSLMSQGSVTSQDEAGEDNDSETGRLIHDEAAEEGKVLYVP